MKSSILRNISRIFFWGVFLCCSKATGREPVSIHLELAKNTLALAEATWLTAYITNNTDEELLLDNRSMFCLAAEPYPFELHLLTPEGENWLYQKGRTVRIDYSPQARLYFWLSPKQTISDELWLFVSIFAPEKTRENLEKMSPGKYRYYATYKLPDQEGQRKITIYSDTVELIYLPLKAKDYKSLKALREMNSLSECFIKGFSSKNIESLKRIISTNTPYSEAAHALLAGVTLSHYQSDFYQKFIEEKTRFDSLYPDSPFQRDLLKSQVSYVEARGWKTETDSLLNLLSQQYPHDRVTLNRRDMLKTATAAEIRGGGTK